MYRKIQDAVNAARPGQVIEILDDSVYNEQVTIDGRENAPWKGVTGGKNGITIRYVPSSPSVTVRPTIRWRDTLNTSPKSSAEAKVQGDTIGASGNFETNGALRIVRADGVIIEGLIVDGVSPFTIAWQNVWCSGSCYPLVHGNAAIAVAVSGNIQIRDCQLKNAYFGIAVKDRNTGGVFGNPNPADNDNTIPLSGFGKTGSHLFEYNKIGGNNVGVYFESSWDRGSTVRYNLIYNNYYHGTTKPTGDDYSMGGIKFKDNYLSPVAIYNNTFYNNERNICGAWQVGAQHLVYNNIFSRLENRFGQPSIGYHTMDGNLPYRMKHCIVSADDVITVANQAHICPPDNIFIQGVQMRNFGSLQGTPTAIQQCNSGQAPTPGTNNVVSPGAPVVRAGNVNLPSDANIRWLETDSVVATSSGGSVSLPILFKSTNPASADFLEPKWEHEQVEKFIRKQGWPAGTLNDDGTVPDLGAIQYAGKRPADGRTQFSRARLSPFSVVTVTGTTATASIVIDEEVGSFTGDLTIKYIRWIAPVPDNKDASGQNAKIIDLTMIHEINGASAIKLSPGSNKVQFTLPKAVGKDSTDRYGFLEIVLQGTVNGKIVTTDVGFLPYRQLDYILDITVVGHTGTAKPVVQAGAPVEIRVRAMDKSEGTLSPFTRSVATRELRAEYTLFTATTSRMWQQLGPPPSAALVEEPDLRNTAKTAYDKTYTVYFTKAGDEVVSGAGLWCNKDCDAEDALRIAFLGDLEVTVRSGKPDRVAFLQPIPKSQLAGATPPTISGTYDVQVQVQDRFENPVDTAVAVTVVSSHPAIADIADRPPTVLTGVADGIAGFTARVGTNSKPGDTLNLFATINYPGAGKAADTASLRVGRVVDGLRVFYFDSGKHGSEHGTGANKGGSWRDDFYEKTEISALIGSRQPVSVKIVNNGDTVVSKSAYVCVTASSPNNIRFSATETDALTSGPYVATVRDGVAKFWITSTSAVDNVSLMVSARISADCASDKDNGISDGSRGGIEFFEPEGNIRDAVVRADGNGNAIPDYVEVRFAADGGGSFPNDAGAGTQSWNIPTKVTLRWPGDCAQAASAEGNISVVDSVTIGVTFSATAGFPAGYSGFVGSGNSLLTVHDAVTAGLVENEITLFEAIGPLIAKDLTAPLCGAPAAENPRFIENKNSGVTPDTLRLWITETLGDPQSLVGKSLLMSSDESGTGETELTVTYVKLESGVYTLALSPAVPLVDGYWIKLNPGHAGIVDNSGNPVHADNRRVQMFKKELPPVLKDAWYVTNDTTGKASSAYLVFDKKMSSDDDVALWFAGGVFEFDWDSAVRDTFNVTNTNAAGSIRRIPGAGDELDTVVVNLNAAFVKAVNLPNDRLMTGGNMNIKVKFNPQKDWSETSKGARDKASPVLISAALQMGAMTDAGVALPDTLIITYSEGMSESDIRGIAAPVSIFSQNRWTPVTLSTGLVTSVGAHTVVRYLLEDAAALGGDPQSGDSVKINEAAGVSDLIPNVQDNAGNRRVALVVNEGNVNWQTTVKKNPFKDSTVVVMTPYARAQKLRVEAQIKLYDNMGKLVIDEVMENKGGGNAIEWVWRGRNQKGRYVGTGTYLLRAVCVAKTEGDKTVGEPQTVSRSIGFVRGWSK
jgi:hypothetical protein